MHYICSDLRKFFVWQTNIILFLALTSIKNSTHSHVHRLKHSNMLYKDGKFEKLRFYLQPKSSVESIGKQTLIKTHSASLTSCEEDIHVL